MSPQKICENWPQQKQCIREKIAIFAVALPYTVASSMDNEKFLLSCRLLPTCLAVAWHAMQENIPLSKRNVNGSEI